MSKFATIVAWWWEHGKSKPGQQIKSKRSTASVGEGRPCPATRVASWRPAGLATSGSDFHEMIRRPDDALLVLHDEQRVSGLTLVFQ